MENEPKFAVGDKVIVGTKKVQGEGVVEEVERMFRVVDANGKFVPDGLTTLESTIKSIQLPYQFDGETLVVHYPQTDFGTMVQKARSETSKFWIWGYSVRLVDEDGYLVVLSENQLKKA